jgi:hypothetical protein
MNLRLRLPFLSVMFPLLIASPGWAFDVSGMPEDGDLVGASAVVGDFDCNGFDDVAIGAPGESVGSTLKAGGVHIIYGSSVGLRSHGNRFLSQNSFGVAASEPNDQFGSSLAAGDFNGDGCDDLAMGVRDHRKPQVFDHS